jgi:dTDP-4-dehydrorhamnose 3,5-epimerase
VLYDTRPESPTKGELNEFVIGVHNPILVAIPPGILHGFKCVSEVEAMVINCPTEVYNPSAPDEFRVDAHSKDIPYDWSRKDR